MRDLIVSLVILGLMPACFKRPFVGLAVFSWLAYMRVQDLAWGPARGQRWSFYVAALMLAGFIVSKERRRFFLPDIRTYLMMAFVLLVGISLLVSKGPLGPAFEHYVEFVKIIGIALFTTAVVTNRNRLRVMIWVIALSMAFFGIKSGLWGIANLGRVSIIRGPGGMLYDNNDFSLALAMAVPMMFHLGWTERKPEVRKAFFFAVPMTVITVGLTRSRGGFLSVATAIGMLIWRSKNRLAGIVVGLCIAISALLLAPEDYKNRLASIAEYKTEGSAQGRIRAWGIAYRMAVDNPVFGVGYKKFGRNYLKYCIDPSKAELEGTAIIVAHNSYFQIWAECGTPAILCYLALILLSFLSIWRVRRMAKRRFYTSWILNYATMFEASLLTFMVGATFLNRAHFDLFYQWVALILVFDRLATKEMLDAEKYPERSLSGDARLPIRHVVRPGFQDRSGGGASRLRPTEA
ncbi:MAG: putative O-glycosylation ligase, exosortase A system-associated [Planctomycetota bacterium]